MAPGLGLKEDEDILGEAVNIEIPNTTPQDAKKADSEAKVEEKPVEADKPADSQGGHPAASGATTQANTDQEFFDARPKVSAAPGGQDPESADP